MAGTIPPASREPEMTVPGSETGESGIDKKFVTVDARSMLADREPTAEELLEATELTREDLASLDRDLQLLGIQPAARMDRARLTSSHMQTTKKKPKGKPGRPRNPNKRLRPNDGNVRKLDVTSILGRATKQLMDAGVPFIGAGLHVDCKPINRREVIQQLMQLPTRDVYAVARILLTWKPQRLLSERHVSSILTLILEGRKASIPGIIDAIAEIPAEVQATLAGETPDKITQETRDLAGGVFDSNRDQTVRAPSKMTPGGRSRKPGIDTND